MAPVKQAIKERPIHLRFQDVRRVLVTPEDENRFVTTVQRAAFACQTLLKVDEWRKEFESLLSYLNQWAEKHKDTVAQAYVGVSSEGLTAVVITKGQEYQLTFDDEVTRLDIELANQFPNCQLDVLQSPECEPETRIPYLSLEHSIQVYGDRSQPQGKGQP